MPGKSRAVVIGVVTVALAAVLAVPALGNDLMCALRATPGAGTYGSDVALQPSVTTETVTGDKFDIQTYEFASQTWVKYGEGLTVEDTGTIDPQYIMIDDSMTYPAIFRTVFLPKSSKNTTAAVSDPIVVLMQRNAKSAVAITAPKVASRNKSYSISATVKPDSGIGKIAMRIKGPGGKVVRSTTLSTDEFGYAASTFRVTKAGRYRIEMRWIGNRFGAASAIAVASVTVR